MTTCKFCGSELDMTRASQQWLAGTNTRHHPKDCELTALRALRDRLVAVARGPQITLTCIDERADSKGPQVVAEICAIIALAEVLAKE